MSSFPGLEGGFRALGVRSWAEGNAPAPHTHTRPREGNALSRKPDRSITQLGICMFLNPRPQARGCRGCLPLGSAERRSDLRGGGIQPQVPAAEVLLSQPNTRRGPVAQGGGSQLGGVPAAAIPCCPPKLPFGHLGHSLERREQPKGRESRDPRGRARGVPGDTPGPAVQFPRGPRTAHRRGHWTREEMAGVLAVPSARPGGHSAGPARVSSPLAATRGQPSSAQFIHSLIHSTLRCAGAGGGRSIAGRSFGPYLRQGPSPQERGH